MSLPVMRRGLSPEGRRNRDRQLGSLTIGLQGVTVHPTHRGRSEANFVAENVRRLHQIQTKCRQRGANPGAPQPLRATPHPLLSQVGGRGGVVKRGSVERGGSAHSDYFSLSEDQPDAPLSSFPVTGEVAEDNEEQLSHPSSPSHHLQIFSPQVPLHSTSYLDSEVNSNEVAPQVSHITSQAGCRPSSSGGHKSRPQSSSISGSRPQSPSLRNSRPQGSVILEPIATKLTQTRPSGLSQRVEPGLGCNDETGVGMGLGGKRRISGGDLGNDGQLGKVGLDCGDTGALVGLGIGIGDSGILGSARLSQEARKMRLDTLMTRIKSQKPSCELNFNKHYKAIENQHRLLLDNSDKLSVYDSIHGSRDDLHRSVSRPNSRPGTAGSVRSVSCDRNTQRNKNVTGGQKSVRANSFVNELRGPRQPAHPKSPQIRKKSNKGNTNDIKVDAESFHATRRGKKQVGGEASKSSVQAPRRGEVQPKVRSLVRARSNLERSHVRQDAEVPAGGSYADLKQNPNEVPDSRRSLANTHSSSGDLNLNCTLSSSGDFYLGDHNSPIVNEPKLRLNIRPDSNATTFSEVSSGRYPDSSHSVLPVNNYSPPHYRLNRDSGTYNTQGNYASADNCSVRPDYRETRGAMGENFELDARVLGYENGVASRTDNHEKSEAVYNQNTSAERTGENAERNDGDNVALAMSTPLPGISNHGTSPDNPSPTHVKRNEVRGERQSGQGDTNQPSSRPTLRRSQSLKNIHQTKQQQQQQQQRQRGELPPSYKKGKIPRYLAARREEERRAAEAAAAVDPACPPGHSPLPDHDRRNTLHLLRKSQAEVMRELATLPVAQDTLRVRRVRQDLEDKLTQIEEGLRIFSQPRVYIMNDE